MTRVPSIQFVIEIVFQLIPVASKCPQRCLCVLWNTTGGVSSVKSVASATKRRTVTTTRCCFAFSAIAAITFTVWAFGMCPKVSVFSIDDFPCKFSTNFGVYATGRWHCDTCKICTKCFSTNPEGHPNPTMTEQQKQDLSMIAHWTHEYMENAVTKISEHKQTLCVPCLRKQKN